MPRPSDLRPHPKVNYPGQGPSLPGPNTGIDPLDAPYQPVWQKDQPGGYPGLDANGNVPASELGNVPSSAPAAGSITTAMLAPGAADGPALGVDVVTTATGLLGDVTGTVGATAIAAGAVTGPKIAANAVTSAKVDATVEVTANKNVANGYPGLDANSMVLETQLYGAFFQRSFESFGGKRSAGAPTLTSQTAAWLAAQTWSDSVLGGSVVFGGVSYTHMPLMELHDHMRALGTSMWGARLQFDSTLASGSCIYNHVSTNGTTDANAYACAVERLTIDCTQMPGWGTNATDAILWNRNPQFGSGANPADNGEFSSDAFHVVRDVFIWQPPRDGLVAMSMGSQHWENVLVYQNGRYGFQTPFDSVVINCTAGFTGKEGFMVLGAPARLVGCKAFSSGNIVANRANGYGFHCQNMTAAPTNLVGCEAQDNWAGGFFVDGCTGPVGLIGCSADSNSVSSAGTYPGFDILNSPNTQLVGCRASERMVDGVHSYQTHAVNVRGTSTNVHIDIQHVALGGSTIGTVFGVIDSTASIAFCNARNLQGFQSGFSATVTPDFFAGGTIETLGLAGAGLVNAPINGPYPQGTRGTIIFKQDATGGHAITWNAAYVNTPTTNAAANGYTVGKFVFDNSVWVGGA